MNKFVLENDLIAIQADSVAALGELPVEVKHAETVAELLTESRDDRRRIEADADAAEAEGAERGHHVAPAAQDLASVSVDRRQNPDRSKVLPAETRESSTSLKDVEVALAGTVIRGNESDNDLGSHATTTPVTIYGGWGFDTLKGGTADDQLYGEDDNDELIGWQGSDTLDGGEGYDTVSYATETGGNGIVVNLTGSAWTYGDRTYQSMTGSDTWGNIDTYSQIESVIGSQYDDIINAKGNPMGWALFGGDGNDTLIGSWDPLLPGSGLDDILIGGAGDDHFNGGAVMYTGPEAVHVDLVAGTATGQGNDTFGSAISAVYGGDGDDILKARSGQTLDGGAGNDRLYGGTGSERLYATQGADTIYGSDDVDHLYGNWNTLLSYETWTQGRIIAHLNLQEVGKFKPWATNHPTYSDYVYDIKDLLGTAFGDKIVGSVHHNFLGGLGGDDTIVGGLGNDTLEGGADHDLLEGESDHDSLVGGEGNDTLLGGAGNDVLIGGAGADSMVGGAGDDAFYVDHLDDTVLELDGTTGGNDTVYISVANFDGNKLGSIENVILVGDGSVVYANNAPEIAGVPDPVTVTVDDNQLATPFANITILDDSPVVTVTVTMDDPNKGWFRTDSNIWANGVFTITGDVATVQAALRALKFDPAERPNDPVGSIQTTNFTIKVVDSLGLEAAPNSNVSVDSVAANRAPIFTKSPVTYTVADSENVNLVAPFKNSILYDYNVNDVLTVTITLDSPGKGVLVPVNGGSYDAETGVFTVTGTADQVRAALESVRFNPTDRPDAPAGGVETTTFTIVVTDQHGLTSVPNSNVKVDSVRTSNDSPTAPALSGGTILETARQGDVVGTLSSTDPNGDALTFQFADALAGSNGRVSADRRFQIVDGVVKVYNQSDVTQDTTFTYTIVVTDPWGGMASSDISITVLDANRAPTNVTLSGTKVDEHASTGHLIGTLSATDPDGDVLTYSLVDDAGGRVELVNNQIRVKNGAAIDFEQMSEFTITVAVSDGGKTVNKTFTIAVDDVRRESVTGTAAGELIRSGSGNDTLSGGGGNDTLGGGGGQDDLIGGAGSDAFLFDADPTKKNADLIQDFNVSENDQIHLARSVFTGFGLGDIGMLKASAFVIGTAAKDADDRIIYDQATGRIYYDADGATSAKNGANPILVATINSGTALTHESFFIV